MHKAEKEGGEYGCHVSLMTASRRLPKVVSQLKLKISTSRFQGRGERPQFAIVLHAANSLAISSEHIDLGSVLLFQMLSMRPTPSRLREVGIARLRNRLSKVTSGTWNTAGDPLINASPPAVGVCSRETMRKMSCSKLVHIMIRTRDKGRGLEYSGKKCTMGIVIVIIASISHVLTS